MNPYQGGNRTLLTAAQDVALLERLKKDDMITQTNVKEYLLETFGVEYDLSSISKKLKRLGVKNKTGRPVNIRKDSEGEVEFKKNFKN